MRPPGKTIGAVILLLFGLAAGTAIDLFPVNAEQPNEPRLVPGGDPSIHVHQNASQFYAKGTEAERDGKSTLAESCYLESLRNAEQCNQPQLQGAAAHRLGVLKAKERNFTESERYFRKASPFREQHAPFHCDFAKIYLEQRRFSEAEICLKTAALIAPGDRRVLYHLGYAIASQPDRQTEGLRYLKLSLGEKEAYRELARIYRAQENEEQASFAEKRAESADPNPSVPEISQDVQERIRKELTLHESKRLVARLHRDAQQADAANRQPAAPQSSHQLKPLPPDSFPPTAFSSKPVQALPDPLSDPSPDGSGVGTLSAFSGPQQSVGSDPLLAAIRSTPSNLSGGTKPIKPLPGDHLTEKASDIRNLPRDTEVAINSGVINRRDDDRGDSKSAENRQSTDFALRSATQRSPIPQFAEPKPQSPAFTEAKVDPFLAWQSQAVPRPQRNEPAATIPRRTDRFVKNDTTASSAGRSPERTIRSNIASQQPKSRQSESHQPEHRSPSMTTQSEMVGSERQAVVRLIPPKTDSRSSSTSSSSSNRLRADEPSEPQFSNRPSFEKTAQRSDPMPGFRISNEFDPADEPRQALPFEFAKSSSSERSSQTGTEPAISLQTPVSQRHSTSERPRNDLDVSDANKKLEFIKKANDIATSSENVDSQPLLAFRLDSPRSTPHETASPGNRSFESVLVARPSEPMFQAIEPRQEDRVLSKKPNSVTERNTAAQAPRPTPAPIQKAPVQALAQSPIQTPAQTLVQTPIQTPAQTAAQTPTSPNWTVTPQFAFTAPSVSAPANDRMDARTSVASSVREPDPTNNTKTNSFPTARTETISPNRSFSTEFAGQTEMPTKAVSQPAPRPMPETTLLTEISAEKKPKAVFAPIDMSKKEIAAQTPVRPSSPEPRFAPPRRESADRPSSGTLPEPFLPKNDMASSAIPRQSIQQPVVRQPVLRTPPEFVQKPDTMADQTKPIAVFSAKPVDPPVSVPQQEPPRTMEVALSTDLEIPKSKREESRLGPVAKTTENGMRDTARPVSPAIPPPSIAATAPMRSPAFEGKKAADNERLIGEQPVPRIGRTANENELESRAAGREPQEFAVLPQPAIAEPETPVMHQPVAQNIVDSRIERPRDSSPEFSASRAIPPAARETKSSPPEAPAEQRLEFALADRPKTPAIDFQLPKETVRHPETTTFAETTDRKTEFVQKAPVVEKPPIEQRTSDVAKTTFPPSAYRFEAGRVDVPSSAFTEGPEPLQTQTRPVVERAAVEHPVVERKSPDREPSAEWAVLSESEFDKAMESIRIAQVPAAPANVSSTTPTKSTEDKSRYEAAGFATTSSVVPTVHSDNASPPQGVVIHRITADQADRSTGFSRSGLYARDMSSIASQTDAAPAIDASTQTSIQTTSQQSVQYDDGNSRPVGRLFRPSQKRRW